MATRSRSLLFLNFRNSFSFSTRTRRKVIETEENAGLISNGEEVTVEMSVLPPRCVEEIEDSFLSIRGKIATMQLLYKKNALPGFDDRNGEDASIDEITEELSNLFLLAQRRVKDLTRMGISNQSEALSKNIQNSLAAKLQELSTTFRKAQSQYLRKLRKQETQGAATNFHAEEKEDDDLDAVFIDAQMAVSEANDQAISQREKEITEIAKSIVTLSEIFRELQTMVIDQGTVLDRIDYNIEQTNVSLSSAHQELMKASEYQNNSKAKICIIILAIIVFIFVIVLYFKFSSRQKSV